MPCVLAAAGTDEKPITLCGPRKAVITGEGNLEKKPYILHVKQSSYIRLLGFTLVNGFKGTRMPQTLLQAHHFC